jgi:hypothetical protein
MTRTEAHQILDGTKNGIPTPQYKVILALLVTGDLGISTRHGSAGMDQEIPGESQRGWPERSQDVVGQNHQSHHQAAR